MALIISTMTDPPLQHRMPPVVLGPPQYSTLGRAQDHPRRFQENSSVRSRSRSRSPTSRINRHELNSPPNKKSHTMSDTDSDNERAMDINNKDDFPELSPTHSFLLTNFDDKFRNPKLLLQQFSKYLSRDDIKRIIPTRNGIIIQSHDRNLATKIRNRHSYEIFGKSATLTRLESKPPKQPPPPRRQPTLSVVIRGVEPTITDSEVESELKLEGFSIIKCIRIKTKTGEASYMVRVLTNHQETIDDLLSNGALIYKKLCRVEPSHSSPPLPIRCEKCQTYNDHPTSKCTNNIKCGFCSESHLTKSCTNLQRPPKCTTCGEAHPTFSYKCKARPTAEPTKPELIVPIRTSETPAQTTRPVTSIHQPITIDQVLAFITVTLQNIHPFQRQHVLQQIQYAARSTLNVSFNATYSGPYVHFHGSALETAV